MKPVASLVRYRCTNPEHQRTTKSLSDTMTIHERSWAFCPYDVRVSDHLWTVADPSAPVLAGEPQPSEPLLDSPLTRERADLPAHG
jgi:hypothetical protein